MPAKKTAEKTVSTKASSTEKIAKSVGKTKSTDNSKTVKIADKGNSKAKAVLQGSAKAKPAKGDVSSFVRVHKKATDSHGLVSPAVAREMMADLCKLYPDADCELTYKNDFELLIAVIMSAQTTDVQVNKVTPKLYNRFPNAAALAAANPEEVKDIIKPTGYYNNKAKLVQACAAALVEKFGGNVPKTLDELITLPGVGRKTANVLLGVIHNIPGWTPDTHVQRLTMRLGMTQNTDPYKIELDLQKLFPKQDWTKYSITLIWHGRRLCFARNPDCPSCPLKHICPSSLAP